MYCCRHLVYLFLVVQPLEVLDGLVVIYVCSFVHVRRTFESMFFWACIFIFLGYYRTGKDRENLTLVCFVYLEVVVQIIRKDSRGLLVHNGTDAYVQTGVCGQFPFPSDNCQADVASGGNTNGVKFILFSETLRLRIYGADQS